jgi:hypothetical protein
LPQPISLACSTDCLLGVPHRPAQFFARMRSDAVWEKAIVQNLF